MSMEEFADYMEKAKEKSLILKEEMEEQETLNREYGQNSR